MDATQFLDLIQKSDRLEKDDFLRLEKIRENFPYFQIPHVIAARYDFLNNGGANRKTLAQAAISSPDRIWLKQLVEKPAEEDFKSDVPEAGYLSENLQVTEGTVEEQPKTQIPRRKKRPVHKDDLIETIKRKEKKEILDSKTKEQIDLIKAFSKKDIKLATIKEIEANQNTENLAESSTKLHDHLLSESFARILTNQGKKGKAEEIYEKLILKFPDKRAYFADLIEKLKE